MPFVERSYYQPGYIQDAYYETTIEFVGIVLPAFRLPEGFAYLMTIHIRDENTNPITLHLSHNHPAGIVSGQWFDPIIDSIGNLEKSIIEGSGAIGTRLTSTLGNIFLDMENGKNLPMTRYRWRDGTFDLFRGPRNGPASLQIGQFELVYQARIMDVSWDDSRIELHITDSASRLNDPPIEKDGGIYNGVGTIGGEFAPDLIDKLQPRTLGHVFNVPPPLLHQALQIYDLSFARTRFVNRVYDNMNRYFHQGDAPSGLPTDPLPPPGWFVTQLVNGLMQLGSSPAGKLSVDIQGYDVGGSWTQNIPDMILQFLQIFNLGIVVDEALLNDLASLRGYAGGIYLGPDDKRSAAEVLDLLCGSIGAVWFLGANDTLKIMTLAVVGPTVGTIEDEDMISRRRDPPLPTVWKVEVLYKRNSNVHTTAEIQNPDIEEGLQSFALNEWRTAQVEDTEVREFETDARTLTVETAIHDKDDADDLAGRLFTLYSNVRHVYRVTLEDQNFRYDIGNRVLLNSERLDADNKHVLIVKISEQISTRRTDLVLWG